MYDLAPEKHGAEDDRITVLKNIIIFLRKELCHSYDIIQKLRARNKDLSGRNKYLLKSKNNEISKPI